jgi:hypothetical protein
MCREHAPEAVAKIVAIMRDPDPKVALPAAIYLIDRGFGRPPQKLEGIEPMTIQMMHLTAATEFKPGAMEGVAMRPDGTRLVIDLSKPALE